MTFWCKVCSKKASHKCSRCKQVFFCGDACWGTSNHKFQCVGAELYANESLLGSWVTTITLTEGIETTAQLRHWISEERAFPRVPNAQLMKDIGFSVALWFKCIEDIFHHDYSDAFFLFWTGQDKRAILGAFRRLIQGPSDFWISFGETFPYSFPLQQLTPVEYHDSVLYKQSKRPITSMQKYLERKDRFAPDYIYDSDKDPAYEYFPVTRYSATREGGLYNTRETQNVGTFYYFEPESNVHLKVKRDRVRTYLSKDDAFDALFSREERMGLKRGTVPDANDPLLYSAEEVIQLLLKSVFPRNYDEKDLERDKKYLTDMPKEERRIKCYCAFKFQMYAASDVLDDHLLKGAREQDIDVLIFESEAGSRQRVKEVFDLRNRDISFENLWEIYKEEEEGSE